jgi:hypothetical protein
VGPDGQWLECGMRRAAGRLGRGWAERSRWADWLAAAHIKRLRFSIRFTPISYMIQI